MENSLHQNASSRKRKYEEETEEAQKKKTKKQREFKKHSRHAENQQSNKSNTFEADCFTDAVNLNKLSKLIQTPEPGGVLLKLITPRFGFMERMTLGSTTLILTELLIQVIAIACQSKDTNSLNILLCHISDSKFMKVDLLRYLNLFITDEGMSSKIDVLQQILSILKILVGKFPSKSLDTVTPLMAPIHYLHHSRGMDISMEDLDEELLSVRRHIQLKVPTHDMESDEICVTNMENFRWLSTAPTCEDMKGKGDPYLRKNKIFLRYTSVNDYLDVQFRLLREDLIRPLREGLADLLESRQEGNDKKRKSVLKVYQKVQIVSWRCSQNGVIYKIHFDTSRLKRVRWSAGKRLIFGSLVCLSADQFQTMLIGTIAERNPNDLSNGIVFVNFENETTQVNSIQFNCYYKMIESPAYYEPYKNVLGVLQYLDEETLPFQKYLLNQGQGEIPPPKYIRCTHHKFNFTPAMKRVEKKCIEQEENFQLEENQVSILTPSTWPSAEQLGLDDSQYGALTAALTKEFAVIQGPPGTGKTFIGVLVVQLLLANKYKPVYHLMDAFENRQPIFGREPLWDGPILIVCYTNHALDQFLEEIIKQHPKKVNDNKIVRLGGRCSSENPILKRCQLNEIMRQSKWRKAIGWARSRLSEMENQLTCLAAFVELAREEMLHENVLKDFMSHGQFEMLTRRKGSEPSVLLLWLYDRSANAWQSNVLREAPEDTDIREQGGDCEDQWDEQFGRQCDVDNKNSVKEFSECKEMMRKNAFFYVNQDNAYFKTWQCLRKMHNRFDQTRPSYDVNVWDLSLDDRWRLYNYWVSRCISENMTAWQTVLHDYSQEKRKLDTLINNQHCDILTDAEIVAMTTTVAAKNNHLLKTVKPKIVIVEEAAEVLEAHIVASLSDDCEHLILIGDHQQLRPKPADDRLAKHYWLQISLFERMLLNKMKCECLAIQHRMRPEISKLLVPHIYKSLRDHSNVHEYENIVGVMGNLFFLNHSFQESSVDDLKSHSNEHEASFIAAFCKYLLNIGYSSDKITVLTLYTGQLFLLRKYMPKEDFEGVRITPVDNFQGEENDIILLSLVRSNKRNNIGFLGISNRVCVALSRARKGLYIIGNGDLLRDTSPLWRDILDTMRSEKKLVEKIPLGCRKHPDNVFNVSCAADFNEVPAFGCKHPCEYRLDCGHVCDKNCHPFDQKHEDYKCLKPCEIKPENCVFGHACQRRCSEHLANCYVRVIRTLSRCQHEAIMPCGMDENKFRCKERCKKLCKVGHQCKKICWEDCGECVEPVTRMLTLCQHEATMPCHMNEESYLQHNLCIVQVERILTQCGHLARMECHCSEYSYSCIEACKRLCPEGHECPKKCHEICGKCEVKVEKVLPRCQHVVRLSCNQSEKRYACMNKCSKSCPEGHYCPKLCNEPCGDCTVLVLRTLPLCEHEARVACHVDLTEYICRNPCKRLCPSGHKCSKICGVKCGNCRVTVKITIPKCKHSNTAECYQSPDDVVCPLPCRKLLSCGHKCQEICGQPECTNICKTRVEKLLLCGHKAKLECFEDPKTYQCRKKVEVTTCTYGHKAVVECGTSVSDFSQCQTLVTRTCSTKLHRFTVFCSLQNSSMYDHGCQKKCNVKLKCGHRCGKTCQQCVTDAKHSECTEVCNKYFPLCSHKCRFTCGYPCATCHAICVIKCHHRSLEQGCDIPYKPCDRPCRWTCPHHSCKAICSHPCDRAPCNEPCQNKLRCGHDCIGLCGEVCPKICRICDNVKLKETAEDLSVKITEKDRFIILKPCDHVVEKTCMDSWVKRHMKILPPYKLYGSMFLKCPVCTSKVSYCPRYNREMKTYELHMNMAKARIMDSKKARQALIYTASDHFNRDIARDFMKLRSHLRTLRLLCETQNLLHTLEKSDRLRLTEEIEAMSLSFAAAVDDEKISYATSVIRAYRIYLEMQVYRLKRFTRGPKLRIVESCEDILKSLSSIAAEDVDFQKMWHAIKKVGSRLSAKLDKHERKDDIDDYIQHMNQLYDLESNANFASHWYCCTNGHIYSRLEDIEENQIDSICLSCHPAHERLLDILQPNRPKSTIIRSEHVGSNEHCHDESKRIFETKLKTITTTTKSSANRSGEPTIGQVPLKKEADISHEMCTISSASAKMVKRLAAEATTKETTAQVVTAIPALMELIIPGATAANVTSKATMRADQDRSQDTRTVRLSHAEGSASSKRTYSEKTKDLDARMRLLEAHYKWSREQQPDCATSSRKRQRQDSPTDGSISGHAFAEEEREDKRSRFYGNDYNRSNEDRSRQRTNRRTPDEERCSDRRTRSTEGRCKCYYPKTDRPNFSGFNRPTHEMVVHLPYHPRRINPEDDTSLQEYTCSSPYPY